MDDGSPGVTFNMLGRPEGDPVGEVVMGVMGRDDVNNVLAAFLEGTVSGFADTADILTAAVHDCT